MIKAEVIGTKVFIRGLTRANRRILNAVADGIEEGSSLLANTMARGHPKHGIGVDVPNSAREVNKQFRQGVTEGLGLFLGQTKRSYRYVDRTGQLTGSIRPMDVKRLKTRIIGGAEAGGNVDYAVHVEYGTSRMDAFPFARPAAEAIVGKFGEIILKNVERAL